MAGSTPVEDRPPYTVVPMDRLRRVTAKRMRASVEDKPHVTLHRYAAAEGLAARRTAERAAVGAEGAAISLTAVLVSVVARALAVNRRLNGRVEDGEIRLYEEVNIGVAVEVPGGLVVPVIRAADAIDVTTLASRLAQLAETARSGRLRPEDMSDATFTISNLGAYGIELFTPIISPPQLAILGVGASATGVAVVDGELVPRTRLGLSLSFDHAAADGSDAARVLADIVRAVEAPDDVLPPLGGGS